MTCISLIEKAAFQNENYLNLSFENLYQRLLPLHTHISIKYRARVYGGKGCIICGRNFVFCNVSKNVVDYGTTLPAFLLNLFSQDHHEEDGYSPS